MHFISNTCIKVALKLSVKQLTYFFEMIKAADSIKLITN